MNHSYHLNDCVSEGGCGAKIEPGILNAILKQLSISSENESDRLLVGFESNDDACVYRLTDELAIIQTVDFFPPLVDDPYLFGEIAAANAISDIYAMGGTPIMGVNLLTFPCTMDFKAVSLILQGGLNVASKAGVVIGGGHSIADKEPKYGMSVVGTVHPDKIWQNSTIQAGDVLVMTKRLGHGIYSVASRGGILCSEDEEEWMNSMLRLNKEAALCAHDFAVHACTDITGFGLVGHGLEMAKASNVSVTIHMKELPFLTRTLELASMGMLPAAVYANRKLVSADREVLFPKDISLSLEDALFDPQTSGGLLIALSPQDADSYLSEMHARGEEAFVVGEAEMFHEYYLRFV